MVFVDVGYLLGFGQLLILVLHVTVVNVTGKGEPDSLVLILQKLCVHAQDLIVVQLLDVVAHLEAHLGAILVLIIQDQFKVVTHAFIVIGYILFRFAEVQRCSEFDYDGLA